MMARQHSQNLPLIIECSFDVNLETTQLSHYNECLSSAKDEIDNPNPDQEAGTDDPLFTQKTREPTIRLAIEKFHVSTINEGSNPGGWKYHRERPDKKQSNYIRVAMNTLISIEHGISKEAILEVCQNIPPP